MSFNLKHSLRLAQRQLNFDLTKREPEAKPPAIQPPEDRRVDMRYQLDFPHSQRHKQQHRPREWSVSPDACCSQATYDQATDTLHCHIHGDAQPAERPVSSEIIEGRTCFGPWSAIEAVARATDLTRHGLEAEMTRHHGAHWVTLVVDHPDSLDTANRLLGTFAKRIPAYQKQHEYREKFREEDRQHLNRSAAQINPGQKYYNFLQPSPSTAYGKHQPPSFEEIIGIPNAEHWYANDTAANEFIQRIYGPTAFARPIERVEPAVVPLTHENIVNECERLHLQARQTPYRSPSKAYEATGAGVRVYWTTSSLGGLLGSPRVVKGGVDTHARTINEIKYLVQVKR